MAVSEYSLGELSTCSGVSTTTIKYYLREGLLPPGDFVSERRAVYSEKHIDRLRLIRSLSKVAGLPLAKIKKVLTAADAEPPLPDIVTTIQSDLLNAPADVAEDDAAQRTEPEDSAARARLEEIVDKLGWNVEPTSRAYTTAVRALEAIREEGLTEAFDYFEDVARNAEDLAGIDMAVLRAAATTDRRIHIAVAGLALRQTLTSALVMLAHQNSTSELLGDPTQVCDLE